MSESEATIDSKSSANDSEDNKASAPSNDAASGQPPKKKSNRNDSEIAELYVVLHTEKDMEWDSNMDEQTVIGLYTEYAEAHGAACEYVVTKWDWDEDDEGLNDEKFEKEDDSGDVCEVVEITRLKKGSSTYLLFHDLS
jgi:hypothetical protein